MTSCSRSSLLQSLFSIVEKSLQTHIGCDLVLYVALEAVHLGPFLGISYDAVYLGFWVRPYRTNLTHLSNATHKPLEENPSTAKTVKGK